MKEEPAILIPKIEPDKLEVVTKPKSKLKIKFFVIPSVILLIIFLLLLPILLFGARANKAYKQILPIVENINIEDTNKLKSDLALVKTSVSDLKKSYKLFSWMKIFPIVGKYVGDLGHSINAGTYVIDAGEIMLTTVEPYLEVLGFKDDGKDSTQTSQERIDFIINSIPEILPKAGDISEKFKKAEEEMSNINPNDYPEKFKGIDLREKLKKGLDLFKEISGYISESKPLLETAPYLLGVDSEDGTSNDRKYLVLFQNDKELRATGGFLTAYSIMKVSKAKFEPVSSDDIYNLDAKYKPSLPAPTAIVDLIKGPYVLSQNIRLRDMNYSPDFKVAMDLFFEEAKDLGLKDVDGIIAVDTGLLVNLLDALGEIGVPGFGNFSTKIEPKCNCPQVIYELESFADVEGPIIWDPLTGEIILRPKNSDNRKKIIGPLMNSILANSFGSTKDKLPKLINAVFKSITEKHVLFYLHNEDAQKAVEGFGIAGRMETGASDYLHINDSNLGGRKSNLYAKAEVEQDIVVNKEGLIEKTITITYKNPEKHDGWLNSVLPNWVRVYVPEGSKLTDAEGLEKQYETTTELGKTVFSGFFKLRPEGVSKVIFKYILPFKKSNDYKIYMQKQPGTDAPLYRIITSKSEEEFLLNIDKEIRIKL
ncbi:hypothetical protein A2130_03820 [Candidatus Woesebacteria bacterium GWC2_33_12]|uniref:DUF4012 domain-containing protein n=1 Tax=Candidatus Woesebacteria bacterium GW2011_GWB1_33_22 TaxID=1618566 RepID=A0A0G0C2V1_9BACT|nr:MAG: hypothetical protein UR29_C0001G0085 [Candidatus Woesebacteria bacterium GW2011_GWC2_33_12]KKP42705.1 MAG: hypothetical protein UR33_C0001G0066 [Candidatus Woesebacteria bacterium GW2011_GWA2_33_20]KKP45520.1 MAG: hypothetical protein UR35_C0001G0117 [Candidatus Woesebacteria bacterium GW2011_GWB1_33_22]KKP47392.1 MAG: hypothetical protein UR37_C0001G0085 [Microgenomates group bacterium GW2011_GWC1_33_28]KKP51138.1 MAG: hypothetical protein UR41_C0001G0085 [Candidatus Woesebacteria bact